MHVLIVGANGQLGRAVVAELAAGPGVRLTLWGGRDHNIAYPGVAERVTNVRPDVLINCAAWTQVDEAETHADVAFSVNSLGPRYLAEGCSACGATMVQISTNEVFPGRPGTVYYEYDRPQPGGVYARSKLGGEIAAAQVLDRLFVVRIGWLFGVGGNHFPSRIIAAAERHQTLRVVDDEVGNPTCAGDVARALAELIETRRYATYHLVNGGIASRYEWAKAVLSATGRAHIPLTPIGLKDWPRPAPPPPHAVLANQAAAALGIELPPWEVSLAQVLEAERNRYAAHNMQ